MVNQFESTNLLRFHCVGSPKRRLKKSGLNFTKNWPKIFLRVFVLKRSKPIPSKEETTSGPFQKSNLKCPCGWLKNIMPMWTLVRCIPLKSSSFPSSKKTRSKTLIFCPMAVLQSASKHSRTIVYAHILKRIAPCHQPKSKRLRPGFTQMNWAKLNSSVASCSWSVAKKAIFF